MDHWIRDVAAECTDNLMLFFNFLRHKAKADNKEYEVNVKVPYVVV